MAAKNICQLESPRKTQFEFVQKLGVGRNSV
jgi:hypothetical protein